MSNILLLKNCDLFTPEPLGLKELLVINEKIISVADSIDFQLSGTEVRIIDAQGAKVIPGYVDQHVHIIGGGGESGPYSRTPEVQLSDMTAAGITTVIGVLGTDGTSRHSETLLAKARALETEGITARILTGSYEIPMQTITGDARRDIILINDVIGIGEIAVSDHRSSQPTMDELKRILTQARVGGMLSGKAGVVQFHMGVGEPGLKMLFKILDKTEIPGKHFIPTHINRSEKLFEEAKEFARRGGYIDITSGVRAEDGFEGAIKPSEAIRICLEENVPMDRVTMSSDGNGCMSVFMPDGSAKQLAVSSLSLHEEVRDAVLAGVPVETAIRVCGETSARANGLWPVKGCIKPDSDADILILDENLMIDTVIARGRVMIKNKEVLVKGNFEK